MTGLTLHKADESLGYGGHPDTELLVEESWRDLSLQGYLAHKKHPHPRTLQWSYT